MWLCNYTIHLNNFICNSSQFFQHSCPGHAAVCVDVINLIERERIESELLCSLIVSNSHIDQGAK